MRQLDNELIQLRDQVWRIARESLESKETNIYRSLTDIAEKLTNLIRTNDKESVGPNTKENTISIFAQYRGERYEAQLDVTRINGGRRPCIWMKGQWWTAGGSIRHITNTSVNGWRGFWRYNKNGVATPLEELKKQSKEQERGI